MLQEIIVGTWNALNAFGDERLSRERMLGALEVVKHLDADVIAIPEMARRGVQDDKLEGERLEEITEHMRGEGYEGLATDYTQDEGERNAHYMSIWSRIKYAHNAGAPGTVELYGKRKALRLPFPDIGPSIHGVHLDDRYPDERIHSANA